MIQIILIAILSLLAQLVFPWWSLAIVAFLVCFWRSSSAGQSFFAGFYGVALVWLIYAIFLHSRTDGVFTGRMSELLFKTNSAVLPGLVTAIVGGLIGGFAGLSGYFVKQATGNQPVERAAGRSRS
ncbi:hypothetical protein GO730_25035 [Spirosoma sp. HMF3257]|uniref:Uncharacterized protein n=1 Tax=Spirosoma telluris TaxID=2183553 RepID=A0A327NME0_9BACT|nr:hypothetical protein [Spirosoma telluris]RAI76601.1 hypothetical protein HMF3257_24975 [Spirosoma telluris]